MIKLQEIHSESNPIAKISIEKNQCEENCCDDYKKKQEIKNMKRKATYIFANNKYIHDHNMIKLQEAHSGSNLIAKISIEAKRQCKENLFAMMTRRKRQESKT